MAHNIPTIMGKPQNRSKGVISIILCFVVLIAECLGFWFLSERQFSGNHLTGTLRSFDAGMFESLLIKRTVILGVIQFLLMLYPMIEYLFVFHNAARKSKHAKYDRYTWYVCPVIAGLVSLVTIFVASGILLTDFWIILIQIMAMAIVILVPRFFFPPN